MGRCRETNFLFVHAFVCAPVRATVKVNYGIHPRCQAHMSCDMTKQQNECAPSEDSDQPGHPPSLIRVFAVCMKKAWVLSYPLSAQWRLIRLGGCPGWSKSSLGAQSLCWFCHVVAHIMTYLQTVKLQCSNSEHIFFRSCTSDDGKLIPLTLTFALAGMSPPSTGATCNYKVCSLDSWKCIWIVPNRA